MSIPVFGVTAAKVRARHFPQLPSEFSTTSSPTAVTVGEAIDDAGSELVGKLLAKGVVASTINAAPATYPESYAWCAKTVRLIAAIDILGGMTGQDPAIGKKWATELKQRFLDLDERGYLALGSDAPAPAQEANGPRWHGASLGLDLGDADDASDLIPTFTRNDEL